MSELFRREVIAHATRRLAGTVVLAAPLSVKMLGGLLAGILFGAALFAATASYSRKATVAGWLVPDLGLIRAATQSAGLVQRVLVREGDVVERGSRLVELALAAETVSGNRGETVARSLLVEADALRARAHAQLARLKAEHAQGETRLVYLTNELKQASVQAGLQDQRLRLARNLVAQSEGIAAKGFLSRNELDARRSAALSAEQDLAAQRRQMVALEREIGDLRARMSAMPIEIASLRAETKTAEMTLLQRSADAEAQRAQFVVASVAGRIAVLPVATG